MIVREMTVKDIPYLNLKEQWMKDNYAAYLENGTGPAWIIENDGKILCGFGAAFLWQGCCEVWFSLVRKEKTISIVRIIKEYLKVQTKALNIRRMHATVKCDFETGRRFIEFLGFKCETPSGMQNYNPDGTTAYLYSRTT